MLTNLKFHQLKLLFGWCLACCLTRVSPSNNSTSVLPDHTMLLQCWECQFTPTKGYLLSPKCLDCFCDNECLKYGDCCIDILIKFRQHTHSAPSDIQCISPKKNVYGFHDLDSDYGYFMVTTYTYTATGEHSCNLETIKPVTSVRSGKTYINANCAIRNKELMLMIWETEHRCDHDGCAIYFQPPETVSVRVCDALRSKPTISTCNNRSSVNTYNRSECERYYYPVYLDEVVYQNIFCYMCSGGLVSKILSEFDHPLRALVSFNEDFAPDNTILECDGSREWIDTTAMKCRPVLCYGNNRFINRNCIVEDKEAFQKQFSLKLMLVSPNRQVNPVLTRQLITNSFAGVSRGFHADFYTIRVSEPVVIHGAWIVYGMSWFRVTDNISLLKLQRDSKQFTLFTQNTGGITLTTDIVNNHPSNVTYKMYYETDKHTGLCCNQLPGAIEYDEVKYIPVTEQLICAYIEFELDEYKLNNQKAYISHLNITLRSQQYHLNAYDQLVVCLEDIQTILNTSYLNESYLYVVNNKKTQADVTAWYLTLVCITISLLCLLMSFITFLVNSELRTLPGKSNMALVVFLFSAQLALLCGIGETHNSTLCQAIGVIIHYLWLCVIFWMNVCSFHMFKVFVLNPLPITPSYGHLKQMLRYGAYACFMPILIIIATITTNLKLSGGTKSGYGGIVCYLSSKELVAYCFVVPLSLVIVSNIIFFLSTVIYIHRVKQTGKQSGSERNNIYIYMKLSVVTGLFWLVAIVAEVMNNSALEYTSIILNGSQGVFLFVAFSCNKNVLRLWKTQCDRNIFYLKSTSKTNSTVFHSNNSAIFKNTPGQFNSKT